MSNLTELTKKLWTEYFTSDDENVMHLLDMFCENSSVIGTGKHEFYKNRQDLRNAVRQELQERKDIIFKFDELHCDEIKLRDDVSIVYGKIAIRWINDHGTLRINMESRFSIVFEKCENEWKIVHIHLSTPNSDQMSGEFYPKTLVNQVETAKAKIKSLTKLASADSLTGLINLRTLKEKYILFPKKDTWLFVIDIDNFKDINDQHGHLKGDHVLIALSEILTGTIRENDLVCRMGGDEFILLCTNIGTEEGAVKLTERLLSHVYEDSGKHGPAFGISVGLTRVAEDEPFEDAFNRADHALYHSKRSGKGRFSIAY